MSTAWRVGRLVFRDATTPTWVCSQCLFKLLVASLRCLTCPLTLYIYKFSTFQRRCCIFSLSGTHPSTLMSFKSQWIRSKAHLAISTLTARQQVCAVSYQGDESVYWLTHHISPSIQYGSQLILIKLLTQRTCQKKRRKAFGFQFTSTLSSG